MAERTRDRLVRLLAVVSGATDAIGFLSLGGAFTSVMTGNMVLLGLSAGTRDGSLALHATLAVVTYALGCAVGARVAGNPEQGDGIWPRQVTNALAIEFCLFVACAIGWEALGGHPHREGWQMLLLGINAVSLGIQSSTIQRFGVAGLSTTYLTGTLTSAVMRLASGKPLREVMGSLHLLLALITGAAIGGALAAYVAPIAPAVQLVGTGTVLGAAGLAARRSLREIESRPSDGELRIELSTTGGTNAGWET